MIDDLGHIMDYDFQQEDLTDFDLMDFVDSGGWGDADWDNRVDVIGDPDGSGYFQQSTGFTCAVVAQQMVLNDFGIIDPATGMCPSESQLTYVATVNGWLYEGTSPADLGKLLDYYNVDNHHGQGIESMVEELAHGHKVIVGIDADELWHQDNFVINDLKDALGGEAANHAIVVKGIKFDENGEPVVVVNDPGMPDGAGMEYNMDTFVSAFEDSDFHYVATDTATPDLGNDTVFGLNYNFDEGIYDGSENWYSSIKKVVSVFDSENYKAKLFSLKNLTELSPQERLNLFKIV
ncbi:C39 family peptidase [Thermodesulfobacteriota bacterium]